MPVESKESVDWNIMCEAVYLASLKAWISFVLLLALTITATAPVRADEGVLLLPGAASPAPVPRLLARVHETFPGRILKVELAEDTPPTYEVKLLGADGKVLILYYDAVTLALDRVQGRYRIERDGIEDKGRGNGRGEPGDDERDDERGDDKGDSGSDDGKDDD